MQFLKLKFSTLFLMILFSAHLASAADTTSSLKEFDKLVQQRDYEKAQQLLTSLPAADQKSFPILWRKSRIEVFLADSKKEKKDQESGYEVALQSAESAISAKPDEAMGYVRKAIAMGKIALFKGILESKEYVQQIRQALQKAIELGNGGPEAQSLAHYILGRTHLKLSDTPAVIRKPLGLGWGSAAEAVTSLKRAHALNPNPMNTLELVKALKKTNQQSECTSTLEKSKTLKAIEPGESEAKQELENFSCD